MKKTLIALVAIIGLFSFAKTKHNSIKVNATNTTVTYEFNETCDYSDFQPFYVSSGLSIESEIGFLVSANSSSSVLGSTLTLKTLSIFIVTWLSGFVTRLSP